MPNEYIQDVVWANSEPSLDAIPSAVCSLIHYPVIRGDNAGVAASVGELSCGEYQEALNRRGFDYSAFFEEWEEVWHELLVGLGRLTFFGL